MEKERLEGKRGQWGGGGTQGGVGIVCMYVWRVQGRVRWSLWMRYGMVGYGMEGGRDGMRWEGGGGGGGRGR